MSNVTLEQVIEGDDIEGSIEQLALSWQARKGERSQMMDTFAEVIVKPVVNILSLTYGEPDAFIQICESGARRVFGRRIPKAFKKAIRDVAAEM